MSYKHFLTRWLCAVIAVWGLTACDSLVYDYEGDCSISYKVHFLDDYNLLFADAFDSEVETVTLYALKADGSIAWQGTAQKDELRKNGNTMTLPLEPGHYELVAWGDGNIENSAPWLPIGNQGRDLLARRLQLTGDHEMRSDINNLFYGSISVDLPADEDFGNNYNRQFVYDLPLVKNTNSLRIVLQQIKGENQDPRKFEFLLESDNTEYDYLNNIVRRGNTLSYAWHMEYGEGEVETTPETRATSRPVAVAELTTGRLMADDNVSIVVRNTETGDELLRFPFIDYLMMVRSFHFARMDEQEYLDRQNDCSIVFFLDDATRWVPLYINVLSWRVVLQQSGL